MGTSRAPFDAELKPFVKSYEKIVLIPRPDYASRFSKLVFVTPQNRAKIKSAKGSFILKIIATLSFLKKSTHLNYKVCFD